MKPNGATAPKGTHGTCRSPRRPQGGRRPAWVRSLGRACRALDDSMRLIHSTLRRAAVTERCAHRRPVRAARDLHEAAGRLVHVSSCLRRAARELAHTNACIARDPEHSAAVPALLLQATDRWIDLAQWLQEASAEIFALQQDVLRGLEIGALVPERTERRPRIVLVESPVPLRAFLRRRRPRAGDRIAPVLRRRRRTSRPAALTVPPRTSQGRAPPFASACAL